MIGYVQLYFKVVGEKETYYAAFDGDFGAPLTRRKLNNIKRAFKKVYSRLDKIYSVSFCSKEEYEENVPEEKIVHSWVD